MLLSRARGNHIATVFEFTNAPDDTKTGNLVGLYEDIRRSRMSEPEIYEDRSRSRITLSAFTTRYRIDTHAVVVETSQSTHIAVRALQ